MSDHTTDPGVLDEAWAANWPTCRPVGHELRSCAPHRWVRFHSLPGSKRYAENDAEYSELLRRHNTAIEDLQRLSSDTSSRVLVITCSWSSSGDPVDREKDLSDLSAATFWRSVLRETDDEFGDSWMHLFVDARDWRSGILDDLLVLVADFQTADMIIAGPDLRWLYVPYDGGGDVLAASSEDRDVLRQRHVEWLSSLPSGL